MVPLPAIEQRTVAAIYEHYERSAEDWRRPHLGASIIGRECDRHLWLSFRWALDPARVPESPLSDRKVKQGWRPEDQRRGRMLRLFSRGHREEAWLIADLRNAGVQVWDRDQSGRQFHVEIVPHFGGSCDGIIRGLPDAPKTPHLAEFKTASRDRFAKLVQKGVRLEKPEHWSQMQVYMLGLELERAFYCTVCKDDDRIYTERVYFDRAAAEQLVDRARSIIAAVEPPVRIGEADSWKCRYCDHRTICHEPELPERNCRTCLSSTPMPDGTWRCDAWNAEIPTEAQKDGCEQHLYIPALLWPHGKAVDASETDRWVEYEDGAVDHRQGVRAP